MIKIIRIIGPKLCRITICSLEANQVVLVNQEDQVDQVVLVVQEVKVDSHPKEFLLEMYLSMS